MNVIVKIFGLLKKPDGKEKIELDLPEGVKVRDIFKELGYERRMANFINASVNGENQRQGYELSNGDEVLLYITVGGG